MAPKKLSPWIQFVMKVKAEHPEKDFKDVLKLAAKLKKQGKTGDVVENKTKNATKKLKKRRKSAKGKPQKTTQTRTQTRKRRNKGKKGKN